MLHRYLAGLLAFFILIIAVASLSKRSLVSCKLPWILLCLVIFQACLGMWTVTLKLLPIVVMAHLLGGMLIFTCLCLLRLEYVANTYRQARNSSFGTTWVGIGVLIVAIQIMLGGWVSSNYAGIACIGFPKCNGQWMPPIDISQGFNLFSPVGANYQGGVLENEVRITIQWIHRLGALLTTLYLLFLSIFLWFSQKTCRLSKKTRKDSVVYPRCSVIRLDLYFFIKILWLLLFIQWTLGIINVVYLLPLWSSVAHNGIAALLLATISIILYLTRGRRVNAI